MNNDVIHIRYKTVEPLKIGDKIFKSAYDWELTEKDLEKAARELGETEEKKRECLRKLKEKLSNDINVKYRQDDDYLLRYLRVRKYDVKRAHQNIKLVYKLMKKHSKIFTVSPEDLKSAQNLNWYTTLPYTDEEGRILLLLNFNRWNLEEKTLEDVFLSAANLHDIFSMNPKCQINGVIGLWDMDGLSMRHVSEILWDGRLWTLFSALQNDYPLRIKKVVVFNINKFVRYLYNLIRPFLKKKIADRCVLLGSDMNELHLHVNPVLLPKRLKGTLEEEECEASQYVLDNLPYLRYDRSFTIGLENPHCFFGNIEPFTH